MPHGSRILLAAVVAVTFSGLMIAERIRPLRRRTESGLRRAGRNLAAGVLSFGVVDLLQTPIVAHVAGWVRRERFGLLNAVSLPSAVSTVVAILLLDYSLWHWHRVNHRVAFFWRFHLVHHMDRDLDATTGIRFHFGEMALSVAYRAVQIFVIGPNAAAVWIYQCLLFVSVLFHHSNTRLPLAVERILVRFMVTPRMHGIHHSDWKNEADSNWSSLLSIWDYLHGTAVLSVPQSELEVGVPAYERPEDVTLPRILTIPFRRQRDDWVCSEGAPRIERPGGHTPEKRSFRRDLAGRQGLEPARPR